MPDRLRRHDPRVLRHAEALLRSTPEGVCSYVDAGARDTGRIFPEAAVVLDFDQPVALMLLGIVGQFPDSENPGQMVRELVETLPAGSYVALSDGTDTSEELQEAIVAYNSQPANSYHLRSAEHIGSFLDGPRPVPPGLVRSSLWRPDPTTPDVPAEAGHAASVVARKN